MFGTLRLSLRFVLPLGLFIGLVALAITPVVGDLTSRWFVHDLDIRARLIGNAVSMESLVPALAKHSSARIQVLFNRVLQDERVRAVGFCDSSRGSKTMLYRTRAMPAEIRCPTESRRSTASGSVLELASGSMHVSYQPVLSGGKRLGELVLVHDMSFVEKRSAATRRMIFVFFAGLAVLVSVIASLIAQWSLKDWVSGTRALLREGLLRPISRFVSPELRPIAKDLRALVRELGNDRRRRDESQISWSPSALKEILHDQLKGDEVLIVSNREPYIHVRRGERIEVQVPASGLVTALEPVMRACSGTWIAHGSGSADREVVDQYDRVSVPPHDPSYQIRRVWLTPEEEEGYYFGFANEGLWPLCHIAHTRPTFRSSDWKHYVDVNQKFADAVVQEAKTPDPVVLVQDYHFALLPRMVKEKLPRATIITFWHIPWANPEAFGICPWREQLLDGMLGSDIIGFHTRFHCGNFLDSVDRFLESRIERESSTITYGGRRTVVNNYPISIEFPARGMDGQKSVAECRKTVRERHGIHGLIGIGVDRMDYTKGILERFRAVERLFELEPKWIGNFSFIQIAAPTRSSLDSYRLFQEQVVALAGKINEKYGSESYQPIILKAEHHGPEQIFEYFRAADVCFVSSLHDGMNLVAKEFVASRDDEQGVLILSQFAGAARELPEALIVNPYSSDQCAAALKLALEMPEADQKSRMRGMRALIQEFNVYRWAGKMLIDASRLRNQGRFLT